MSNNLKGKRLLVLGGTRITCGLIRTAQEMGIVVGVTDYFPVSHSPGKQIADEHYEVSTLNVQDVIGLVREKKFDGVLTGYSDMLLPYYADICEGAGVPCYGTREQFELFSDKSRYKQLCRDFSVPVVAEYTKEDIDNNHIEYPVLVKPVDGSGSRGVTVCCNEEQLIPAIRKANSCSRSGGYLVERYMNGREVTVNWLFDNGTYYLTSIANRHVKRTQGNDVIPLPVGYTYPASIIPIQENDRTLRQTNAEGSGCKKRYYVHAR